MRGKAVGKAFMEDRGKRISGYVKDYVVFDLETTGINPLRDEIIEISALKVTGHELAGEFSTLVHPDRHIPAGATAINGITDQMVGDAPEIKEALGGFLDFIGGEILVGHNIHTFDMKFITRAAEEVWGGRITNDYIDTLYMARSCLPALPHHRLTDLASYFHIGTDGAHRALNDCAMNQQCYEHLGKLLAAGQALACPQCGAELYKRNGRYGPFYGCSNYPRCRYTRNA